MSSVDNGTNRGSANGTTTDHRIRLNDKEIEAISKALNQDPDAPASLRWRFNALKEGIRARR